MPVEVVVNRIMDLLALAVMEEAVQAVQLGLVDLLELPILEEVGEKEMQGDLVLL
jgi:hypothetical protein